MSNTKTTEANMVDDVMTDLREDAGLAAILDGLTEDQDASLRARIADVAHVHIEPYRISERALRSVVKSMALESGTTPVRVEVRFEETGLGMTITMPTLTPEKEAFFGATIGRSIAGLFGLQTGAVRSWGTEIEDRVTSQRDVLVEASNAAKREAEEASEKAKGLHRFVLNNDEEGTQAYIKACDVSNAAWMRHKKAEELLQSYEAQGTASDPTAAKPPTTSDPSVVEQDLLERLELLCGKHPVLFVYDGEEQVRLGARDTYFNGMDWVCADNELGSEFLVDRISNVRKDVG